MNSRNAAILGTALLIGGLFTPIVTMPIVGSISLFGNGTNLIALDLLLIGLLAAVLAARGNVRLVVWPGIAASGVILYEFGSLQLRLSQMRESVSEELKDNPFAGIAQGAMSAVQVQWGWLVLASGAGLLLYAGLSAAREQNEPRLALREGMGRAVAALCTLLLVFVLAWDLLNRSPRSSPAIASTTTGGLDTNATEPAASTNSAPNAEEAAYMRQNLRLYDLKTKYYDSMLDGRVPGVEFKIQNNGNRTLNKVTVRVVFYDAKGNPISEQEYNPVLVSDYSIDDSTPLRPHYIWQQESDKFYEAKNVPSEWSEGKASATISDIEFAPNG